MKAADRTRKRPGGRSARVRDAVLKAAFEVLTEIGVENLTIAEVAARAKVHETSIYRRWGSRRSLILDASLRATEGAIPVPDTGSLRSDLVALIGRAAKMLDTPQGRAILALMQLHDEELLRAKREFWRRRFERLQPIFDRAVARGEFPRDADPIILLQVLIAPLWFRLSVTGETLDDWPVADLVDRLLSRHIKAADSRS